MGKHSNVFVLAFLLFSAQPALAKSDLNEPDEGGIGGTGVKPEPVEILEPPEVPEIDGLIPELELEIIIDDVESATGVLSGSEIPDTDDLEPTTPQE